MFCRKSKDIAVHFLPWHLQYVAACFSALDNAASILRDSVIVGERNKAALAALEDALQSGCRRVAIFYGSAHLPDLDRRLRSDFQLTPGDVHWKTAWAIAGKSRTVEEDSWLSRSLERMASVSGWPLNRYQTGSLLIFSVVLALDLWLWEVILGELEHVLLESIQFLVAFLDKGWGL